MSKPLRLRRLLASSARDSIPQLAPERLALYRCFMTSLQLLDSARHKIALARYHADTLSGILEQRPHDDLADPLRVPLEAHLEGMAYTGTAAAEKTIRSLDPERINGTDAIPRMILAGKRLDLDGDGQAFVSAYEEWWTGRQRGTRHAELARDLRNDAAHNVYEKGPDGLYWRLKIGRREPTALSEFIAGYLIELEELEQLVAWAENIARAATRA